MGLDDYDILECDIRPTALGEALRIRIHRKDMEKMGFRELWEVFNAAYPGRWAIQVLPPRLHLIDQVNKYHLFVYGQRPEGMDISQQPPKGALRPKG